MIKSRVMDFINYKSLSIMWYDILDILIFILSTINLGFWISINWAYDILVISFTSESNFDHYVKLSENTKDFWIISSILFFLISIRLFRIITEMFPSYGALFETIKIALKDLLTFFIAIIVMSIGFIYTTWFLFGSYIKTSYNFWTVFLKIMFLILGDNSIFEDYSSLINKFIYNLYYILFAFIFAIILMQMFISIVIIRYKYLRSIVQLDNEANARIITKKEKEFKNKIRNFLFWKKRSIVETEDQLGNSSNKNYIVSLPLAMWLNFKDLFKKQKLQTKWEIDKELDDMKRTILQERNIVKMKRIELYSHKWIKTHTKTIKHMIVHISYTLLFIWVALMQLQLKQRYSQTNLKMNIENQSINQGNIILVNLNFLNVLLKVTN